MLNSINFFFFPFSVPSKPLNLSVLEVTSTTITIGWREPENLNGAIMGYRVFYIHQNQTYFATIRSGTAVGELITYVLNDLSKWKQNKQQPTTTKMHAFYDWKCPAERMQ